MKNQLPYIVPLGGSKFRSTSGEKEEKNQAIMFLTVEQWEALIKAFDIKKPKIQHNVQAMKNIAKKGKM